MFLCWPPTLPGTNATQHCPEDKGLVSSEYAWRMCTENGTWYEKNRTRNVSLNGSSENVGYTEYINCFNPELNKLFALCKKIGDDNCQEVGSTARTIELVGYSLSLISLIVSLLIFYNYRILRNNRTTIHKNLFTAMLLQVVVRLISYSDQHLGYHAENFPYLCKSQVILLEFTKIAAVMWMFVEGLYLHNAITLTIFQEHSYLKLYCVIGWSVPTTLTLIWLIAMVLIKTDKCWYLYNFLSVYWILEGPSTAFIIINMLFLLNIIRILVLKLRQSRISEIQQIRKAVRAALFLVPLMGTANILFMIDFRDFESPRSFALWSYTAYICTSFQGFLLSTLYCFLNGEVKHALKNSFSLYMVLRKDATHRKHSMEETGLSALDSSP